jgi:hypothetical protein
MAKKRQGSKAQSRKRGRKRVAKDLTAKRSDVQGGAAAAGKLTFGAPSSRPVSVDPTDPSALKGETR